MVDFPADRCFIEVTLHMHANLPLVITSCMAMWIDSEKAKASIYYLNHLKDEQGGPIIEYINND